ncbi:6020_t:CDS:2, partial [Ambispora leptoticha]
MAKSKKVPLRPSDFKPNFSLGLVVVNDNYGSWFCRHMIEKCDICDKEIGVNGQKYCTEHNREYENDCRGKEEEAQQKRDYERIFGTQAPTISQLRNYYLKEENIFGKNDSEKSQRTLSLQHKTILQDPLIDSEDAIISATHLISYSGLKKANLNDKELAKEIKTDSYFCEKLTKFHNSPPDSATGK